MNDIISVRGISRFAAVSLLAMAGAASSPALATNGVVVKRDADPQVTYLRLQRAAEQLCSRWDRHDSSFRPAFRLCFERTLDEAVAKMNEPALMALHRQHQAGAGGTG